MDGQSLVCFPLVFVSSVSEEMNVFQSARVNTLVTGVEIFEEVRVCFYPFASFPLNKRNISLQCNKNTGIRYNSR